MTQTRGFLYVLVTPGDDASIEEVHEWLDNKCASNIPGIINATRYEAIDGRRPEYLAVYELQDTANVQLVQVSHREPPPASLEAVDFRVYNQFSEKTSPKHANASNDGIFRTLALQPKPDLSVEDYNEWYEQDHVPLLSLSPGWLKSTRWTLHEEMLLRRGEGPCDRELCHYLAVHEYESVASFETPEFKRAITSPWRAKVMPRIENIVDERRNFKPQKSIM